jgi:hypothetical protein
MSRFFTPALLSAFLLFAVSTHAAEQFNDDLQINQGTPGIIFNDTDVTGEEWYIRGYAEYFSVFDPNESQDVFYIEHTKRSIFIGYFASAAGSSAIALGHSASAAANHSAAVGVEASSTGSGSIALGSQAEAIGVASTALGLHSESVAEGSTAIGAYAIAEQPWSVILGAIAGLNNSTLYANVGIGTSQPTEAVDVERSQAAARFQLTSFTNTANEAPQYIQRRARGTNALPNALQANDNLGLFSFRGYNGTTMGGSRATITAQAAGDFSFSSTPTRLIFATTPVGQTAPQQVLVITPDGKVQVNGQNLNVPDYVFEEDYDLMPLKELRAFIEENAHLPGIASADEVNSGLHDLAGSDMAYLRKIEELTLYTLQQQDEIDGLRQLERENQELSERVAQLEQLVSNLVPVPQGR